MLAQEGSISGHSNTQLVKPELFLLSVVMGKATAVPLTSLESLWISSDVSRGWFNLIIFSAHICSSPTLSQHSDSCECRNSPIPKGFGGILCFMSWLLSPDAVPEHLLRCDLKMEGARPGRERKGAVENVDFQGHGCGLWQHLVH